MVEKLQEKPIRVIIFPPSHASLLKQVNKLKLLQLKHFIKYQNIIDTYREKEIISKPLLSNQRLLNTTALDP